jgi:hypothetical protein
MILRHVTSKYTINPTKQTVTNSQSRTKRNKHAKLLACINKLPMVRWVAAVKLKPHNLRVKTVNGFTADGKQIRPEKGKTFKLKTY